MSQEILLNTPDVATATKLDNINAANQPTRSDNKDKPSFHRH